MLDFIQQRLHADRNAAGGIKNDAISFLYFNMAVLPAARVNYRNKIPGSVILKIKKRAFSGHLQLRRPQAQYS
ncbi:MAG: hypothetical protein ACRENG_01475 [bacterium]